MKQSHSNSHDFSTVSPSALSLLLLKGNTEIPFMQQAATLVSLPANYEPSYADKDLMDCLRIMHFEARYASINTLLVDLEIGNILELSSGFSFRGLDTVQRKGVYFIDTDLPGIIVLKQRLLALLQKDLPASAGSLELYPLNALDPVQFTDIVSRFPAGELAIVNEGLLMYLNTEEKKMLCGLIHTVLKERGGCWITADIYIKSPSITRLAGRDDKLEEFFKQHNVEENKFDSLDSAQAFFREQGFEIDKEADMDYSSSGARQYMMQKATAEQLAKMQQSGKMNVTWRLKAV